MVLGTASISQRSRLAGVDAIWPDVTSPVPDAPVLFWAVSLDSLAGGGVVPSFNLVYFFLKYFLSSLSNIGNRYLNYVNFVCLLFYNCGG